MKWKIYSASKRPEKSLEKMFEVLSHYLGHRYDSAEMKLWELTYDPLQCRGCRPFILFETFYEGTDMEHRGPLLFDVADAFLGKRGFKIEYTEAIHDR